MTDRLVRAAPIGMVALALGFAACTHGGDGSATERSSTTTSATRATPTTITVPAASSSTTSTSRLGLASVDWARVAYPIDCGSMLQGKVGTQVLQVAYAQPAPDAELALVMVACQAGAGTPPRTIFVFDGAISAISAHLLETLWQDGANGTRKITDSLTASGSSVNTSGDTYSSATIPQCCPDGKFTAHWTWSGTQYKPTT